MCPSNLLALFGNVQVWVMVSLCNLLRNLSRIVTWEHAFGKAGQSFWEKVHLDKRTRMTVMSRSESWAWTSDQFLARSWCSLSMCFVFTNMVLSS